MKGSEVYNSIQSSIILAAIMLLFFLPDLSWAQKRVHSVFFEGTDYELNVYRIYGKVSGKTLLLIGGIQGDEPGGYLSVDHYADISLAKGNLIVVPRANFQSILLRRRKINEDMNRKFGDDRASNFETKVVAILKKLILESDCLLNLHDGSGFFSEKWEGLERNPNRHGQSIIADCDTYLNPKTEETLHLGAMARSVSEQINMRIENPLHHFHFNNHRTKEKDSLNKEQRKSATFYALYSCGIPAFGIETSKSLSLETKVRHHNFAVNAFMNRFDIVPETPGINLDHPLLDYLVVSVNDSLPVVLKNQQTLFVSPGDSVMVSHIEANYNRGLSADIIGFGTISDMRKRIRITEPTKIIVRKDYFSFGNINIALGEPQENLARNMPVSDEPTLGRSFIFFKIRINGKEQVVCNYGHAKLVKGDTIELVDVMTGVEDLSDLTVNFKGYVGNPNKNTGEDRGYVIHTARDLWKRYSLNKDGKTYQVVATWNGNTVGKLFVDLEDPSLKYIVLSLGNGSMHCFFPGDTALVTAKEPIKLFDIHTNVEENLGVKAFVVGPGISRQRINIQEPVTVNNLLTAGEEEKASCCCRIEIERDHVILGSIQLKPGNASR